MKNERVRIADIAEELGLSTATVSNVIHGKTKKISDETVKRVQELLEKRQYIPSMAGILLAQNSSKIIGVVLNDHPKYEKHALEDPYIASTVNALAREIDREGYFLMLKVTSEWNEIPKFASMWNMEGMILTGFCEHDYSKLREKMHIPLVIYDGCFEGSERAVNIEADHFGGGVQAGEYLKEMGHRDILCISDNAVSMDHQRYMGLKSVFPFAERMIIPMEAEKRSAFYEKNLEKIMKYTAIFAVSDYYAMDFISFLKAAGYSVPEDISVIGFDDVRESGRFDPPLTTVHQDSSRRAALAVELIKKMKDGFCGETGIKLPVTVTKRKSVKNIQKLY